MWHQGKNTPRGIADASDVCHGAIGIMRIASIAVSELIRVRQHYIQLGQSLRVSNDLSLRVGHRKIHSLYARREHARAFLAHTQVHPATLKPAGIIRDYGQHWPARMQRRRQNTSLYQYLEAITDAQDQPPVINEPLYLFTQFQPEFIGQYLARGYVITVGKPTGNNSYLIITESLFTTNQLTSMNQRRQRPSSLESESSFSIAISPRGP